MIEQFINPETISGIIGLAIAVGFGAFWMKGKTKLSEFRNLIVSVDDAVRDDRITEEEFQKIWDAAKKVFTA